MKKQKGFTLIELLIVVAIIGIIAAIAIPSLLRARVSANEAASIGDIRTVISAQAAYQSANGGWYAQAMSCMSLPSGCIPSYPSTAPTFLDTAVAGLLAKSGYNRSFTPGTVPANLGPLAMPGSVASYVYSASPVTAGQTGVRGFGGDASGVICIDVTGVYPAQTAAPQIGLDTTKCTILQ